MLKILSIYSRYSVNPNLQNRRGTSQLIYQSGGLSAGEPLEHKRTIKFRERTLKENSRSETKTEKSSEDSGSSISTVGGHSQNDTKHSSMRDQRQNIIFLNLNACKPNI